VRVCVAMHKESVPLIRADIESEKEIHGAYLRRTMPTLSIVLSMENAELHLDCINLALSPYILTN
jgi:hypothetical protein